MEADELVKQSVAAARAGNEEESRRLLAQALHLEPDNVNAWRAAAQLAKTRADTEQALRRVLSLQPGDPWAQENLERLQAAAPTAPAQPAEPTTPAVPEVPVSTAEAPEAAPPAESAAWNDAPTLAGGEVKPTPEARATEEPGGWQEAAASQPPTPTPPPATPPPSETPPPVSEVPPPATPPPPLTTPEPPKKRSNTLVIVLIILAVLCVLCIAGFFVARAVLNRAAEDFVADPGASGFSEFLEQLDSGQATTGNGDYSAIDDYDTTLERNISIGQSDEASLDGLFNAHNWYFEGQAGQDVTIRVEAVGDTDPRVRLIGPSGTVIGEDDDGGGNYDSLLEITLPETGTYTARIDVFSTGTYRITIE